MSALKKEILKTQSLQNLVLETVKKKNIQSPILQRLRQNIAGKTGLVITSYDRMHHRHNRG